MARRRTTRGVKVAGLRSMVLDDVGAREAPVAGAAVEPLVGSLAGRERLDERVAAWIKERERFVRRAAVPNADPTATSPDDPGPAA